MNWAELGIPTLIVLVTGGLFFWHHRITQSTIKNLETRNFTLISEIKKLKEEGVGAPTVYDQTTTNDVNLRKVVDFQAPPNGQHNYPFYDYFIDKIINAEKSIVITGDGFECTTEEGTNIAKKFNEAFRVALSKGVSIVRIETKSRGQFKWASMLAELVKEYGDHFHLYILREKKSSQMASVCVIDPQDLDLSIVEIMLSTQQLLGVKSGDVAGTALFIHGQPYLAQDLAKRVLTLSEPEYTNNPITPTEVTNLLVGEEYYFSFASNMNHDQMTDRCPSAQKVGIGILQNHEIVFNRKGSYRPGGVASVQQKDGARVYGVIWKINPSEFSELDKSEDMTAYRRFNENINTMDGKVYKSHIYKAIPQGTFEPDREYLRLMIDSSKEQDLPSEYIEYLESFVDNA